MIYKNKNWLDPAVDVDPSDAQFMIDANALIIMNKLTDTTFECTKAGKLFAQLSLAASARKKWL